MKPYGRDRRDHGCCPGHDLYPSDTYNNRRSKKARSRDNKRMHRHERRRIKMILSQQDVDVTPYIGPTIENP